MVSEIIWTRQARINLQEIKDFISKDSEMYASRIINLIYSSVSNLLRYPEVGMIVPVKQPYVIRRIVVKKYQIIYAIHNSALYILAIYHSARRPPSGSEFIHSLFE